MNSTSGQLESARREATSCFDADPNREAHDSGNSSPERVLIVGVGNELLSDDGVGVHAVRALQAEEIPGVTAIEVGTAVLHGLHFLAGADRVLVIDAASGGQPPGTAYLFDTTPDGSSQAVTSIHAMGLRETAGLLLAGHTLPAFTFLGVEPQTLGFGMSLSAPVRAALPGVLALARRVVRQWQAAEIRRQIGAMIQEYGFSLNRNFRTEVQL